MHAKGGHLLLSVASVSKYRSLHTKGERNVCVCVRGGGEKNFWVKGGDKKFSRALRAREKK